MNTLIKTHYCKLFDLFEVLDFDHLQHCIRAVSYVLLSIVTRLMIYLQIQTHGRHKTVTQTSKVINPISFLYWLAKQASYLCNTLYWKVFRQVKETNKSINFEAHFHNTYLQTYPSIYMYFL